MHSKGQKTKQAVRQMKSRVLGAPSSHPKPLDKTIPKWAFVGGKRMFAFMNTSFIMLNYSLI